MNILKKANDEFKKKNYDIAYQLYLKAAERYGKKNILYNIEQCEKYINVKKNEEYKKVSQSKSSNTGDISLQLQAAFNKIHSSSTMIHGWIISKTNENESRRIQLLFDNKEVIETDANLFRSDLVTIGLKNLNHGFSVKIPFKYYDKQRHKITLIDTATGQHLITEEFTLEIQKNFDDFNGMLKYNFLNPVINAPFDEEKKRSLAFCDVIAKQMEKISLMNPDIHISILMPVYNRESIVKRAIYSVLQQTYENFELIIIDDGSLDRSIEVVKSIDDSRIRIMELKENQGKSVAINKALDYAKGEWIAYLDSDNTWDKRYLASMVGSIKSEENIEAIYSGQLLFRGEDKEPYAARFCPFNKNLLFNRNYIDHNSFMHHKDIIKSIGKYDESLRRTLDYDFIIRVAEKGVMISTPLLLTNYYYDAVDNSITNDSSLNSDIDKVRARAQNMLLDPHWTKKIKYRHSALGSPITPMSVVVPSYESLEDIKKCISSILSLDEKDHLEIIIVDNNSSEEVVKYLKECEKNDLIKLILNKENYGFTYAVNQGIKIAKEENDIILLNNDAEVLNGSLELLSKFSNYLPDAGLLVPAQILYPETKTMNIHVPFLTTKHYGDVNVSVHHKNMSNVKIFEDGSYYPIEFAPFFCVYIPRRTLNKVGLLDAELGRHYRSDRLYCNSVKKILRQKIYYIPDSRVLHGLQKSTDNLKKENDEAFDIMFKKNKWQEAYLKKLSFENRSWDY